MVDLKNHYVVNGDVTIVFIERENGEALEMLIDTEDLPILQRYNGTLCVVNSPYIYAYGVENVGKKQAHFYIHRYLMAARKGIQVDHINHNTLDNRKSNLRLVTAAQNAQNKNGARKDSTSGLRGVTWSERDKRWRAQITLNRKAIHLGSFKDKEEANRVVTEARAKYMPFSKEALNA